MRNVTGYHREYGKHSNIPDCCIEAFIADFDSDAAFGSRDRQAEAEARWGREWDYAACNACLLSGYRREIHRCRGVCEGLYIQLKIKHGLLLASAL